MTPQIFTITQNAIIKNKDNKILVLKHKTGKYLLPGGRINKGENSLEALKREIEEETGMTNFKINKIIDFDCWTEENKGKCSITFLINLPNNPKIKLSDEHIDYSWIEEDDLDEYNFWHEDIKRRIKLAFK